MTGVPDGTIIMSVSDPSIVPLSISRSASASTARPASKLSLLRLNSQNKINFPMEAIQAVGVPEDRSSSPQLNNNRE